MEDLPFFMILSEVTLAFILELAEGVVLRGVGGGGDLGGLRDVCGAPPPRELTNELHGGGGYDSPAVAATTAAPRRRRRPTLGPSCSRWPWPALPTD